MKINDYFDVREFVPPQIWKRYGNNSIWLLDPKTFNIATAYREWFDSALIVNDWMFGGRLMYRGYRPPRVNIGAEYSQHKFGRAFDCHIRGLSIYQMYKEILDNTDHFKQFGLTTLENIKFTPTWLHSDCRETNNENILIIDPL